MYLIFDFDGTLTDSLPIIIAKFNLLAEQFKFQKVNGDKLESLKDLNSKELIKFLKIPLYQLPHLINQARKFMSDDIETIPSFGNMPEVLGKLYAKSSKLGILTSNSVKNVSKWLKHYNIYHLFDFIHSESTYFGKHRLLNKIFKLYDIDKSSALYIGDETRDIEAAKKAGILSIAVTWGFNSEKALLRFEPTYIAKTPEDLLTISL